jgi:hypothetical protein
VTSLTDGHLEECKRIATKEMEFDNERLMKHKKTSDVALIHI